MSKRYHTSMFIAAQFTVSTIENQPKCPSTDNWIKKLWCMYTTEQYSAIKMRTSLLATCMILEEIMLSEIGQAMKGKYRIFSHITQKLKDLITLK